MDEEGEGGRKERGSVEVMVVVVCIAVMVMWWWQYWCGGVMMQVCKW